MALFSMPYSTKPPNSYHANFLEEGRFTLGALIALV